MLTYVRDESFAPRWGGMLASPFLGSREQSLQQRTEQFCRPAVTPGETRTGPRQRGGRIPSFRPVATVPAHFSSKLLIGCGREQEILKHTNKTKNMV